MGLFATIFGGAAQKNAADRNYDIVKSTQKNAIADIAPYKTAGTNALTDYLNALGLGDSEAAMARFQASPEYQLNFDTAIDQGTQGVNDVALAGGVYNSGQRLKALQDRAQKTSRGFYSDFLKGVGGMADTGYDASNRTANLRRSFLDPITGARTAKADAVTSQYQGIDSLLSGGLKLLGGFKNPFAAAPTSIY